MRYYIEDFIDKFDAIPANRWCIKKFRINDSCCAFGHLGAVKEISDSAEAMVLRDILGPLKTMDLFEVNDGKKQWSHLGSTPKERVINYLKLYQNENK